MVNFSSATYFMIFGILEGKSKYVWRTLFKLLMLLRIPKGGSLKCLEWRWRPLGAQPPTIFPPLNTTHEPSHAHLPACPKSHPSPPQ